MTVFDEEEFQRRAQALAERADRDFPPAWKPRDPELGHPRRLVGAVIRQEEGHAKHKGTTRIAIVRDPAGTEWAVWVMGAVLEREFREKNPGEGEIICLTYEGHREGGAGEDGYEKYTLLVDRGSKPFDWGDGPAPFAGDTPPQREASGRIVCDMCGYVEPNHAEGCPNDIPFLWDDTYGREPTQAVRWHHHGAVHRSVS